MSHTPQITWANMVIFFALRCLSYCGDESLRNVSAIMGLCIYRCTTPQSLIVKAFICLSEC